MFFSVRIEILKAIATKVQTSDLSGFCVANVAKPYLSVGPAKGRRNTFKFVDAIESYCELLTGRDLVQAYERAGSRFTGSLMKTFLVLNEKQLAAVLESLRDSNNNPARDAKESLENGASKKG